MGQTIGILTVVTTLFFACPGIAQQQSSEGLDLDGLKIRGYGQFNPALQSLDDGVSTKNTLVDNAESNSRVGLTVDRSVDENAFGFAFETALGFRQSSDVSQTETPDGWDWERTDLRKLELTWGSDYGKFYLGQGSMATDGIATIDLSGTALIQESLLSDFTGSFEFRTKAGALSGIAISDVFNNLQGTRRGRIRYDTPSFNGVVLRVAAGKNVLQSSDETDYYDTALVYSGALGGTEVEGGLGYRLQHEPDGSNKSQVTGSVSVLLESGLSFALAGGTNTDGVGGDYIYTKLGYRVDFWSVGSTRFSVDYNHANDFETPGSTGDAYGIGLVQQFRDQNIEAYLGYIRYSFEDSTSVAYDDMRSIMLGALWSF